MRSEKKKKKEGFVLPGIAGLTRLAKQTAGSWLRITCEAFLLSRLWLKNHRWYSKKEV